MRRFEVFRWDAECCRAKCRSGGQRAPRGAGRRGAEATALRETGARRRRSAAGTAQGSADALATELLAGLKISSCCCCCAGGRCFSLFSPCTSTSSSCSFSFSARQLYLIYAIYVRGKSTSRFFFHYYSAPASVIALRVYNTHRYMHTGRNVWGDCRYRRWRCGVCDTDS